MKLFDLRAIGSHAATIWIGQLAVMAFAVTDTLVAGQYDPQALATLSIATAVYISISIGLQGYVQGLLPIWGRLHGQGAVSGLGDSVRQALYAVLICSVIGVTLLMLSPALLQLTQVPQHLHQPVSHYLAIQAITLPMSMLVRAFNTFSQSIGQPRWVARLQGGALLCKIPLTVWFAFGGWGVPELGLAGCAWATCATHIGLLLVIGWLLRRHPLYRPYQLLQRPPRPDWSLQRQFLALGLPSSLAIWVEVTSFTTMSLLIAPMGETASAAQQIASTTAALLYMWPLSLAIAGSARVSFWQGRQDLPSAQLAQRSTLLLTLLSAGLSATLLALLREPMASLYVQDAAVVQLAASLLLLVAGYHLADAFQVCVLFLLRCYHVVRLPTLIYSVMLWGLGLGGGYWLAWFGPAAWRGPHAFWAMVSMAMALVAGLFLLLLRQASRRALEQPA